MQTAARRPILHGLTGVRFFAATLVLLFHFGASRADKSGYPAPIVNLLHNGYLGVSLFFILSGFIITYTYFDRIDSKNQLRAYWVSRLSRIYSVYFLALLLYLPFAWHELTLGGAMAVLVMVQAWTPAGSGFGFSWLMQAWTLSVEIFFYISAPWLLPRLRTWKSFALLALCLAAAGLMIALVAPSWQPDSSHPAFGTAKWLPIPLFRMTEFVYGATLCLLLLRHPEYFRRICGPTLTFLNLGVILTILCATTEGHMTAAGMVMIGILLCQIAAGDTPLSRFLSMRAMILLGGASYALYLLQAPVHASLLLLPSVKAGKALNLPVAIFASVVVFLFWEEPARRWLKMRFAAPAVGSEAAYPLPASASSLSD